MRGRRIDDDAIRKVREAYIVHRTEGVKYQELADRYGMSLATLKNRIRNYCQDLKSVFRNIDYQTAKENKK